jgi:hypothetical protein
VLRYQLRHFRASGGPSIASGPPGEGRHLTLEHAARAGCLQAETDLNVQSVQGRSMRDTTSRGDITEFEIATALLRQGRKLLRPLSSACRYDLLIDNEDGTFTRIQCKTGILREGRVEFRLYSISGHRPEAIAYSGQVDAFGVYCPQTRVLSGSRDGARVTRRHRLPESAARPQWAGEEGSTR